MSFLRKWFSKSGEKKSHAVMWEEKCAQFVEAARADTQAGLELRATLVNLYGDPELADPEKCALKLGLKPQNPNDCLLVEDDIRTQAVMSFFLRQKHKAELQERKKAKIEARTKNKDMHQGHKHGWSH